MVSMVDPVHPSAIHPFHAVMLAGTVPLFLGALLADYAYWSSYEIQWSNFASWLIAGALVFGAIALVFAIADLRSARRNRRSLAYAAIVVVMWLLGFCNALHHARDAWAVMPAGLVLSAIVALLACLATWIGFSNRHAGGAR